MERDRLNGIKKLEKAYSDHLTRVDRFTTVANAVAGQLSGTTFAANGPDLSLSTLGQVFTLRFTPDLERGGAVLHLLHVVPDNSHTATQEPVDRWLLDNLGNVRQREGQFSSRTMEEPEFAVEVIESAQRHLIAHHKVTARQGEPK